MCLSQNHGIIQVAPFITQSLALFNAVSVTFRAENLCPDQGLIEVEDHKWEYSSGLADCLLSATLWIHSC